MSRKIDEELITDSEDQSKKEKEREFYFVRSTLSRPLFEIKDKLSELGLYPHWGDSLSFGELFKIRLILNTDKSTKYTFI